MPKYKAKETSDLRSLNQRLADCYSKYLKPLETAYSFNVFHSSPLESGYFNSNPMVMLLGQYSTGKTTFIKHVINNTFPDMRIGPEPTTDKFTIVTHGPDKAISGNVLVSDPSFSFKALEKFGGHFLNRLSCSMTQCPALENVTFVDTPGILSGEKQRLDRGYDFVKVVRWFAENVDRIILFFDAYKLDISDEFKNTIKSLHDFEEKIHIVLNKSDQVGTQELMRVYGALMWSLGRVINTPEVSRVYIGTFSDYELKHTEQRDLFTKEANDLLNDLTQLPGSCIHRKFNDIIRRARLAKVHALIMSHLKSELPMFGKEKKKKELIANLQSHYNLIARTHNISAHDFPDIDSMRTALADFDLTTSPSYKQNLFDKIDMFLTKEIPKLLEMVPKEQEEAKLTNRSKIQGGVFDGGSNENPFSADANLGMNIGRYETGWIVDKAVPGYAEEFQSLNPENGFLSGSVLKRHFLKSSLQNTVLSKIWRLADYDEDGQLDLEEFGLAKYLIQLKLQNQELSETLPKHLVPPSKRKTSIPLSAANGGDYLPSDVNGYAPNVSVSLDHD